MKRREFLNKAGISSAGLMLGDLVLVPNLANADEIKKGSEMIDKELSEILANFQNEVSEKSILNAEQKAIFSVVFLTALGTKEYLKEAFDAALKDGINAVKIKEAIYQTAPYIGFFKALESANLLNQVYGSDLDASANSTTTKDNRLQNGIAVQSEIFGKENIAKMRNSAPAEQKDLQDYLSAMCFGDFYTRNGLDIKERELITLCAILAIGGADAQVLAHMGANLSVGNSVELLNALLNHAIAFVGFPRTLNALTQLNLAIKNRG